MKVTDSESVMQDQMSNSIMNLSYLFASAFNDRPNYIFNLEDYVYDAEQKIPQEFETLKDESTEQLELNSTTHHLNNVELGFEFENDDASWIMASSFMIFTMQTGFGLIESGMCHQKNEVNILLTNIIDVGLGGFIFWSLGYGIAFGDNQLYTTPYYGIGKFLYNADVTKHHTGEELLHFFHQLALSSTATTMSSGSMAERTNFKADH